MLTTAGALALIFPPVFALLGLGLLAIVPAERRAAMDKLVAEHARTLAGTSILAGLSALLVGLLAYGTVGDEIAVYASAGVVMAGYIIAAGWAVWRDSSYVPA